MNHNHKLPNEFVKKVKDIISEKESLVGELKSKKTNGEECWYQNSILPIYDDENIQIGEVIVRYDITDKKIFEKLSITDSLTEVYNRRYFNDVMNREISRATRDKNFLSFIILDIDYFKGYNDANGHKAGDDALVAVSSSIKNSLHRGSDYVFRLGGEEFGVIFTGENEENSLQFANKIKKNIEKLKINHSNSQVSKYITVSIGLIVVNFAETISDQDSIYTMADGALYLAKDKGRNQVSMHVNNSMELF
jgi:diguanylate cyclase (GGDEF)-like protein